MNLKKFDRWAFFDLFFGVLFAVVFAYYIWNWHEITKNTLDAPITKVTNNPVLVVAATGYEGPNKMCYIPAGERVTILGKSDFQGALVRPVRPTKASVICSSHGVMDLANFTGFVKFFSWADFVDDVKDVRPEMEDPKAAAEHIIKAAENKKSNASKPMPAAH